MKVRVKMTRVMVMVKDGGRSAGKIVVLLLL
jgi:hypothetical protein